MNDAAPDAPANLIWLPPPLRAFARCLLTIHTEDPVRRVLNQGLQLLIASMTLVACGSSVWALVQVPMRLSLLPLFLAFLPLNLLAFWLTRRGSLGGGILLMVATTIANALIFLPSTYADPPVIHVLFLLPPLIGVLFVTPLIGVLGALLQTATLTAALVSSGTPLGVVLIFAFVCALDLVVVMLPIVLVAWLLQHTLRRLASLTARLDMQVAERTSELHRQITLREHDISAIVHDIQNRMAVVRAEVDELLINMIQFGAGPGALQTGEARVGAAINAVGDLVDDLRTAVQLDNAALRLHVEPLDLEMLARRVVDQLRVQAAQSACTLRVLRHGSVPIIVADERKLARVLANLVGNAVKYSRQVPPERREVTVTIGPAGEGAQIEIADRGPGLEPQALQLLGQPFTRLASSRGTDGMGLGVYLSRGIVELHGGQLRYASPGLDQGTVVTVWLPLDPPSETG